MFQLRFRKKNKVKEIIPCVVQQWHERIWFTEDDIRFLSWITQMPSYVIEMEEVRSSWEIVSMVIPIQEVLTSLARSG